MCGIEGGGVRKTERIVERTHEREPRLPRTWLVRIGSARDPLSPPAVIELGEEGRLVLGRRDHPRDEPGRFESVDPSMSARHAALEGRDGGHELTDLGSSNGTLVMGQPRSRHLLSDGDVFETGSTFWLYRRAVISATGVPLDGPDPILGSLQVDLRAAARRVARIGRTRVPVTVLGSTGTGKEVVARALHRLSGKTGPFIPINTAAVQSNLVASELFGVVKGAHSTADRDRQGQIRAADGGTVLLDEIGDMPLEVQVSLLRVLQESEVLPVGGDIPIKVDVRFICATHQDIPSMVEEGRFRADLFARLKGTVIAIPDLAERVEDLGLLVGRFLERFGARDLAFTPASYRALLAYPWPLNVRELEKAVETAIALCDGDRIELEHLPPEVTGYAEKRAKSQSRDRPPAEQREQELIRLLTAHRGNVSAVARSMGYSRMQVHRWLQKLDLDPADYRR